MRLPDRPNPWTFLQEEEIFSCAHFSVRRDTVRFGDRLPRSYNSVRMRSVGVTVAPIDDEGCITLIGQYRYVLDRFTWELPSGGCGPGQILEEAAKIELSEETGYRATYWLRLLGGSESPGSIDGWNQAFVAWGLKPGTPHPEPEEKLMQLRVTFAEAVSLTLSGEISHLGSICSLLAIQTRLARDELPEDLATLLRS
jgi:8-oxo-dGTP pyrophosphatase MutT (NUDIX family)